MIDTWIGKALQKNKAEYLAYWVILCLFSSVIISTTLHTMDQDIAHFISAKQREERVYRGLKDALAEHRYAQYSILNNSLGRLFYLYNNNAQNHEYYKITIFSQEENPATLPQKITALQEQLASLKQQQTKPQTHLQPGPTMTPAIDIPRAVLPHHLIISILYACINLEKPVPSPVFRIALGSTAVIGAAHATYTLWNKSNKQRTTRLLTSLIGYSALPLMLFAPSSWKSLSIVGVLGYGLSTLSYRIKPKQITVKEAAPIAATVTTTKDQIEALETQIHHWKLQYQQSAYADQPLFTFQIDLQGSKKGYSAFIKKRPDIIAKEYTNHDEWSLYEPPAPMFNSSDSF